MANLLKKVAPTEPTYQIELTQSELDFMVGVMSDLADNPQRRVRMIYEIEQSYVQPTKKGLDAATSIYAALSGLDADGYDYDEWWEEVTPQAEWMNW